MHNNMCTAYMHNMCTIICICEMQKYNNKMHTHDILPIQDLKHAAYRVDKAKSKNNTTYNQSLKWH